MLFHCKIYLASPAKTKLATSVISLSVEKRGWDFAASAFPCRSNLKTAVVFLCSILGITDNNLLLHEETRKTQQRVQ